jgi:ribosomal-protein-serine acetyltransferase
MPSAPKTIRTERLHLHVWDDTDAPELRALLDANDAHLRPWIPFMRHEPRDLAGTREVIVSCRASFDAGEHYRYAVRERENGALVGETMLIGRGPAGSMEAGYWLDAGALGKGYATEATAALVPVAFDVLGLEWVELHCDVRNDASIAVARRLGAVRVRVDRIEEDGRAVDLGIWRIDR